MFSVHYLNTTYGTDRKKKGTVKVLEKYKNIVFSLVIFRTIVPIQVSLSTLLLPKIFNMNGRQQKGAGEKNCLCQDFEIQLFFMIVIKNYNNYSLQKTKNFSSGEERLGVFLNFSSGGAWDCLFKITLKIKC